MSPNEWIGVAVGIVTLATAGIVLVRWIVQISNKADNAMAGVTEIKAERERDKIAYDERLRRVEAIGPALEAVGRSIEHMGATFTKDLKHMAEMQTAHNTHVSGQLADIKHDYKNLRMEAQAKPRARARAA